MKLFEVDSTFESWKGAARRALRAGLAPNEVAWAARHGNKELHLFEESSIEADTGSAARVPRAFIEAAKIAVLHSSESKWPLLYRILWRITHGEAKLMEVPTDADVIALKHLGKEVYKDGYRMRQYIRFRETELEGNPWYVAWYEPEHDSVQLNDKFFADRFSNMRWSILTPKRSMHWDGEEIRFSPGVDRSAAPTGDNVEPLWVTYYSSIFNPARVKVRAMKAQMPVRNWKNLPEAAAIAPLLAKAPLRVNTMLERSHSSQSNEADYGLAQPPATSDWMALKNAAAGCQACPLWKNATSTVFGEGPLNASVVLVGEQPGDSEDRAGKPFVGPAGQLLDRALAQAGLERRELYVTNAVKHFKWEPRGKRRIHQTPNSRDIAACRPWLEAELRMLKPKLVVALGATAARALFERPVKITKNRGYILPSRFGPTLITIHPSALLRLPSQADADALFPAFVDDLKKIAGR